MHIAIIGTGKVGSALAKKWANAGHHIHLGVRDTQNFSGVELLKEPNTSVHPVREAVAAAEVILLATPAQAAIQVAQGLGDTTSKVIIDAMNIIRGNGPAGFTNTADAVLANTTSEDVVKCFNTVGFNIMENPSFDGTAVDAFVAGDSTKGKEITSQLALDAGFGACYDVGGNQNFQLMEQFALF
ncbi:MAG: NAD(P)-binding domain-containing protein, partial [Bacteroidota bacterium]